MIWLIALLAHAEPAALPAIRARWTAVQQSLEAGALYPLTIDANPTGQSWAAVGTYGDRLTCHRAVPGEAPYPAPAPALVTATHAVSARSYQRTFLYDDAGMLLFAHATGAEQPDWRVYWDGAAAVRVQRGEVVLSGDAAPAVVAALAAEGAALHQLCTAAATRADQWAELPRDESTD